MFWIKFWQDLQNLRINHNSNNKFKKKKTLPNSQTYHFDPALIQTTKNFSYTLKMNAIQDNLTRSFFFWLGWDLFFIKSDLIQPLPPLAYYSALVSQWRMCTMQLDVICLWWFMLLLHNINVYFMSNDSKLVRAS